MSAPDTNLSKQRSRHWGPLTGIAGVLLFVGVLFTAFMVVVWEPAADEAPDIATNAPVVNE